MLPDCCCLDPSDPLYCGDDYATCWDNCAGLTCASIDLPYDCCCCDLFVGTHPPGGCLYRKTVDSLDPSPVRVDTTYIYDVKCYTGSEVVECHGVITGTGSGTIPYGFCNATVNMSWSGQIDCMRSTHPDCYIKSTGGSASAYPCAVGEADPRNPSIASTCPSSLVSGCSFTSSTSILESSCGTLYRATHQTGVGSAYRDIVGISLLSYDGCAGAMGAQSSAAYRMVDGILTPQDPASMTRRILEQKLHGKQKARVLELYDEHRASYGSEARGPVVLPTPAQSLAFGRKGLGDHIESGLKAVGITEQRYRAAKKSIGLRDDCGCAGRKQFANRVGRIIGIGRDH